MAIDRGNQRRNLLRRWRSYPRTPSSAGSERYVALAREASTSGDRVAAENLYQHAEHYFRVKNAASEGHQHHATHPTAPADLETEMAEGDGSEMTGPVHIPSSDKQPYSF